MTTRDLMAKARALAAATKNKPIRPKWDASVIRATMRNDTDEQLADWREWVEFVTAEEQRRRAS